MRRIGQTVACCAVRSGYNRETRAFRCRRLPLKRAQLAAMKTIGGSAQKACCRQQQTRSEKVPTGALLSRQQQITDSGGRSASTLRWQTDPFTVFTGNDQHFQFRCIAVTEGDGRRRIRGLQQNLTHTTIVFVMRSIRFRSILVGCVWTVEGTRMARTAFLRHASF